MLMELGQGAFGKMKDKVHIALVANERYRPGLECTKVSMVRACATPERLVFHEYGDKDMARFLDRVELRDFNGSKLPYLRLFLPELLPECDWVIYSDVDTLWFKDPCELWNERDDSVSICWVKDLDVCSMDFARWTSKKGIKVTQKGRYACSGVALVNLKKWRETNFTDRAVQFLKAYGCPPYPDQDLMNILLADDSKLISRDWDTMIPPYFRRPCVYHITGIGRCFSGADHYDGSVPQYIYWFNYWRRTVLGLPKMRMSKALRTRLSFLELLSWTIGPLLDLFDRLPGIYHWKMILMRLRRQIGFAHYALM